MKSSGIERVVSGGKYIQHFSLQTHLCVPDDGLESYGHLVGIKMIIILDLIGRGKFVGQLSNSWVLIKDSSRLWCFCFCCWFCCNTVTANTKEQLLIYSDNTTWWPFGFNCSYAWLTFPSVFRAAKICSPIGSYTRMCFCTLDT